MQPAAGPIIIELRGEPRGKGRPRFARATGRVYTDAATSKYENALCAAARGVMLGKPMLEGPLLVSVAATFSVPVSWPKGKRAEAFSGLVRPTGTPDADNIMKVLDALNEVVWRDDAQIVEAHVSKRYGHEPSLVVIVDRPPGVSA